MKEKVAAALEKIRPALQADGGDAELIDVVDGVVTLHLTGACGSCPLATLTLRQGVERVIRQEVPGIKRVIAV